MADFKKIIHDVVTIEKLGMQLNVFVHGLISDSPARSKICNSIQFNGNYGCLFCYHPGKVIGRKRVYPFDNSIRIRDNKLYKLNSKIAVENNKTYLGIKG
jgi:hypothetical protein